MNIKDQINAKQHPQDPDLFEQAQQGHGLPSQDPDPDAQVGLTAAEQSREISSSLVGGGVLAGVAVGAAVGATVAGPVGILVGGTLGSVAGAVSAAAASMTVQMHPSESEDLPPDE